MRCGEFPTRMTGPPISHGRRPPFTTPHFTRRGSLRPARRSRSGRAFAVACDPDRPRIWIGGSPTWSRVCFATASGRCCSRDQVLDWAPVEDLVPGAEAYRRSSTPQRRPGRNALLPGTVRTGRLWRINAFWRAPGIRGLKPETQRRYAYSLKVWLDFLTAIGTPWDKVSRTELALFKEWRLSAEDNPSWVSPNAFCVDRAAIRCFYLWASEQAGVANPVRSWIGDRRAASSPDRLVVEAQPAGVRRADVKWLTPQAFRLLVQPWPARLHSRRAPRRALAGPYRGPRRRVRRRAVRHRPSPGRMVQPAHSRAACCHGGRVVPRVAGISMR